MSDHLGRALSQSCLVSLVQDNLLVQLEPLFCAHLKLSGALQAFALVPVVYPENSLLGSPRQRCQFWNQGPLGCCVHLTVSRPAGSSFVLSLLLFMHL